MLLQRPPNLLCRTDESTFARGHVADNDSINRLRIGFDTTSASIPFFQALKDFGTSHPALNLGLVEADQDSLLKLLRSAALDLIFIKSIVRDLEEDLTSLSLPRRRLNVLLPTNHRLAKALQIDLALMGQDTLIAYDDCTKYSNRELAVRTCRRAGFEPPTVIDCNSYGSMVGMVVTGRGYAICPDDPNLSFLRSAVSMIPLLQSWDSPGTLSLWLRASSSHYRDEFLRCIAGKHRSR